VPALTALTRVLNEWWRQGNELLVAHSHTPLLDERLQNQAVRGQGQSARVANNETIERVVRRHHYNSLHGARSSFVIALLGKDIKTMFCHGAPRRQMP
jgi:hypothetical protein